MNLNNLVFINNLPSIDLHGFDRETASIAIKQFINDNLKMHNEFIVIVHGNGTGVLKSTCAHVLKQNKCVIDYKIWYNNDGSTVVQLDKQKFN